MKKMLLTVAAAGVLAVPVGVIVAGDGPTEPAEPAPASTDPDQVQDRDRRSVGQSTPAGVQLPDQAGEGESERDCECDGTQTRQCEQAHAEDGNGDGPMARNREQTRAEDGNGDGPMARNREQTRVEEGTGDGPMTREREQVRVEEGTEGSPTAPEGEQTGTEEGSGPADTEAPAGGGVESTTDGAQLEFQYGQGNARRNG